MEAQIWGGQGRQCSKPRERQASVGFIYLYFIIKLGPEKWGRGSHSLV